MKMGKIVFRHIIFNFWAVLVISNTSLANTIYVNPDGTGDVVTVFGGYLLADNGDTVIVGPGIYHEQTIILDKSLCFKSVAGPDNTFIYNDSSPSLGLFVVFYIENVNNCIIDGFTMRGQPCDLASVGGCLIIKYSNAIIRNCIIRDTWCANGAGMYVYGEPSPEINNNLIYKNEAFIGAGIIIHNSSPVIYGNTIVDNHATVNSGAIKILGDLSKPSIKYNLICYNSAPETHCGGIDYNGDIENLIFECNCVWSNFPAGSDYCGLLSNQTGINGNISTDPLFCGLQGSDNYYLQQLSPCAEVNVPLYCSGKRIGYYPVYCETANANTSWGALKSRLIKEEDVDKGPIQD